MHNNPVKWEDHNMYVADVREWADTYGYEVYSYDEYVSVYVEGCNLHIDKYFYTGQVVYRLYTFPESVSQFLNLQSVITQYTKRIRYENQL